MVGRFVGDTREKWEMGGVGKRERDSKAEPWVEFEVRNIRELRVGFWVRVKSQKLKKERKETKA